MRALHWSRLDRSQREQALARPTSGDPDLAAVVAEIINAVREDGDEALLRYGKEFDGVVTDTLETQAVALATSANSCSLEVLKALDNCTARIRAFHEAGIPAGTSLETAPGLTCSTRYLPINTVGLYIPGGSAPLVSTVLMLAIPAALAGCPNIVLCTPPGKGGSVHPAVLHAAYLCGVEKVFATGGAQAIAAMAYGTDSIPKCDKVFGPGNAWVTEAKQQVSADPDGAAQDLPAGPSEVLVIADETADPTSVCWDLLSQAEHGPDSQAILVSDSPYLLERVAGKIEVMAAELPRAAILEKSLARLRLIQADNLEQAIEVSNRYAPEHLILNCLNAAGLADQVTAAGSVFIGPWTPESLGDYSSGTNHVLPTYGYARAYGGLSVADFMRRMTLQSATREGLGIAGSDAMTLAATEGLDAHRMAVEYRLSSMESS